MKGKVVVGIAGLIAASVVLAALAGTAFTRAPRTGRPQLSRTPTSSPSPAPSSKRPPQRKLRVREQNKVDEAAYEVLSGWDRSSPTVQRLLGRTPRTKLLPGPDDFSYSTPRRVHGGWRVEAIVRSTKDEDLFTYRYVALDISTKSADVHVVPVQMSEIGTVESIRDSTRFASKFVSVPVVLPQLPPETELKARSTSVYPAGASSSAEITLNLEGQADSELWIQYGIAKFDGCGGDSAQTTTVVGQPGLLLHESKGWSTLIWPATHSHPEGSYGLSGPFRPARLMVWAEQMEAARRKAIERHPPIGC